jgi:PAP2 superfamily
MKNIIGAFCLIILFYSCNRKTDYEAIFRDPLLYSNTVHELNRVVMGNNFSPIVASRNYTYANIAAYEVVAAGYPDQYISLAGQLKGLPPVPKPQAGQRINFPFASLLAFCTLGESVTFPKGSLDSYTDSLKALAKDHGMPSEEYENSLAYADAVSRAIMEWAKKDMYLQTRSMPEYAVDMTDSTRWVPTPPAYAPAMEPNWKMMRCLVMDSCTQFVPPAQYKFNIKDPSSDYYKEVMAIKTAVENLTPEQKHIADFWDDNPFKLNVSGHIMFGTKKFSPPGHWQSIVGIAAKKAHADFPTTVYAFAKTSIAMYDAFIECWEAKYRYNTARPETVINRFFDQNWRPYLQTPPFPEYTCGHSTCSAAAAEALTSIFGDNFAYTDSSELEFGIKNRSYTSFRDAAIENNWARFYGGIHFHHSCLVSTEYGKKVGVLVVERLKMKKGEPGLMATNKR